MSTGNLFRRNGVYQLRRTVDGKRKTVSLGVSTKPEAERARDRILTEDSQRKVDRGRLTAGGAWAVFRDSLCRRECAPSTLAGYEAQWRRFQERLTDTLDLASLTRAQVSEYLTDLKGAVGPNTWNKHLNALKYVWKTIQTETGATLPDVFLGVRALPVPLVRHEAFTTEQVKVLYRAASGEMQDIIGFAGHTGLRRVDVLMFKKSSYDAVNGLLRLTPQKTCRISAQAVLAPTALVSDVLERRMGQNSPYLFPETASVYAGCPQTVGARFQRYMVKTLALNGDRGLYGMHSLRHFFKSTLLDAGVPEGVINAILCHGQSKVGARYTHPSSEALREAAGKLPELRVGTD